MTAIGGWTLVRKLANGGMGTVWKVTKQTGVGAPLVGAMKIPLAHVATDERETRRFLEEARMLTVLDHPHIVRVIDAGVDDGIPFLVMQWVNGIDLLNLRKAVAASGSQFSVATALWVTSRILAALEHAHTRNVAGRRLGIVHRDVKPANVLISVEGHVMLTDFGVASMYGDEATGNAHGTPRYMSPEQFRGKSTHQSDLWGAGAVLWEMLAGAAFRNELSSQEVIDRLAGEVPVAPVPSREGLSPQLLDLLHNRLLAVSQLLRCWDATAALEAVEACPGFDIRANTELRGLVRKLRSQESSGFTELMLAIPEDPHLEIDVIRSAVSGQLPKLPKLATMGVAADEAPTDRRTPPELRAVEPSNPTLRETIPPHEPPAPTEVLEKPVGVIPEPDAPTQYRRPRRVQRAALLDGQMVFRARPVLPEGPPDIAGVIHTPVLIPRPAGTVPPDATDRLPRTPPRPVEQPTDMLTPGFVAAVLASTAPPPRTPEDPVRSSVSAEFDGTPEPTVPLLEPYQKRVLVGLALVMVVLTMLALMVLGS